MNEPDLAGCRIPIEAKSPSVRYICVMSTVIAKGTSHASKFSDAVECEETVSAFPDPVAETARTIFGIPYVYPYQRFVIANILERKDQIVILPTGAGKSLCFHLPSSQLDGPTLIVYPLLSLISDQKRRLIDAGSNPCVLTGGQSRDERADIFENWTAGKTETILTNPETLLSRAVAERLPELPLAHIVLDEAHCVSEWGDTFRPSYIELGNLLSGLKGPVLSAFTATASETGLERIAEVLFKDRSFRLVRANADRPNIFYKVEECLSKDRSLENIIRSEEKPLLVFVRSRKGAEKTAFMLRERLGSRSVAFYHAGLSRDEKASVEKEFFSSDDGILVSTSAYGMGVDKKNIRTVVHTHVPPSVEAYLQESGRGGRDGLRSTAILLHGPDDVRHRDLLSRDTDRYRYDAMLSYVRSDECRRTYLLSLLGQGEEACSGCDVCDPEPGKSETAGTVRRVIAAFAERYGGKFTVKEAASILSGRKTLTMREGGYHYLKEFGILNGWNQEDTEAVIFGLITEGSVLEHKGFLPGRRTKKYLYPGGTTVFTSAGRFSGITVSSARAFSKRFSGAFSVLPRNKKRPSSEPEGSDGGLLRSGAAELTEP